MGGGGERLGEGGDVVRLEGGRGRVRDGGRVYVYMSALCLCVLECMCMPAQVCMHRERERERDREKLEGEGDGWGRRRGSLKGDGHACTYGWIYVYFWLIHICMYITQFFNMYCITLSCMTGV